MTILDIVIGLIVAISVITGFMAGFVRVGIGLAAVIIGLLCGFWFYGVTAAWVSPYLSSQALANAFGFFIIFIGIVVAGALLARLIATLFKMVGLSWLDRLLGAAIGFVRGAVIAVVLVVVVLACAPIPPPDSIVHSRLMPYVIEASDILATVTPREIKNAFEDAKTRVQKMWSERARAAS